MQNNMFAWSESESAREPRDQMEIQYEMSVKQKKNVNIGCAPVMSHDNFDYSIVSLIRRWDSNSFE